jgi:hypothetical protein
MITIFVCLGSYKAANSLVFVAVFGALSNAASVIISIGSSCL